MVFTDVEDSEMNLLLRMEGFQGMHFYPKFVV